MMMMTGQSYLHFVVFFVVLYLAQQSGLANAEIKLPPHMQEMKVFQKKYKYTTTTMNI